MTNKTKPKKRSSKTAAGGALVALALLFGWCGRGFFLGDGKPGDENAENVQEDTAEKNPSEQTQDAGVEAVARCVIRVDTLGVQMDSKPIEVSQAVEACSASGEADLTVTGDAKFGTADELRAALLAGGIRVFEAKAALPDSDDPEATTPPAGETAPPAPESPPAGETTPPAPETTPPAGETTPPSPETAPPSPETTPPSPETTPPAPETTPPPAGAASAPDAAR